MKAFFFGLLLGIAVTLGAVWYLGQKPMRVDEPKGTITDRAKNAASETREAIQEKAASLNLTLDNIRDEMAHGGKVARQKMADLGHSIADASADTRITAAIKAKYVADPDVSAFSTSVNTTAGVVTLSGTAGSAENIRKAIQIAWDTDGVTQVISTIQVKE